MLLWVLYSAEDRGGEGELLIPPSDRALCYRLLTQIYEFVGQNILALRRIENIIVIQTREVQRTGGFVV